MRLHGRGKKTALQRRTSSWQPIGVTSGMETRTEEICLMKSMSWIISPQVLPFRADSKPFAWAAFAVEPQEEKHPLCHSLLCFANDPCRRGLPPPLPASFAGLSGNPRLSSRGPDHDVPGEQWSTRSGNMLIRAETHFSISCACHGTTIVFMVRISSSLVSVQRSKLGGKKAILRSLRVPCDGRMLERCLYPQTILCVSFLQHMTLLQITTKVVA